MILGKTTTNTILPLIGLGLFLSACTAEADYAAPPYAYGYPSPIEGSLDFDYGGWGGWHHGWDHGHWDQGRSAHAGWGHGFTGHAGFAGHGGSGGHGGGGHR